ncbi:PspC domain-containing protein [Agromyces sp. NPDC055520]
MQDDAKGDSAAPGPHADGATGSTPSSGDPGAATPAPGTGTGTGGPTGTGGQGTGFYDWLRRLGVPRRAGWLGGVCAGVAARLGIDPIIVRGIVVVVAVLGAPFVLLYAIAWVLLPDLDGEIHFERLMRGIVDPAIVGIAVMGVIGFIPLVQGGWLGWRWWPDWPTISDPIFGFNLGVPLRVLWVLILVGGVIALVVWLARRSSQNSPDGGGARMASAAPAAAPGSPSASSSASPSTPAVAFSAAPAPSDEPDVAAGTPTATTEPPVPAEGADAAAIAEWRAQHEAWRISHAEWKSGQEDAERAARAEAAAENKARAIELTAQADAARAARRASRPRASAAFVFTVLGLALVAGAAAAIWALKAPSTAGFAIPIAVAATTLLLSIGMVIAALRRRRSGALAFFTMLSAFAMAVAVLVASLVPQGVLTPPSYNVSLDRSQRLVQPFGDAYIQATPWFRDIAPVIELTQGNGDTWIMIEADTEIVLDASEAGEIEIITLSADYSSSSMATIGGLDRSALLIGGESVREYREADEPVDAKIVLEQGSGMVHIQIHEGE